MRGRAHLRRCDLRVLTAHRKTAIQACSDLNAVVDHIRFRYRRKVGAGQASSLRSLG